jgi:hypothetical protein
VYCWGANDAQQATPLNNGIPYGTEIALEGNKKMYWLSGPKDYLDVSAGELGTCAVSIDYTFGDRHVDCWGYPFSFGFALWGKDADAREVPLLGFEPERAELTYNEVCALDTDTGVLDCWEVLWSDPQVAVPPDAYQCI